MPNRRFSFMFHYRQFALLAALLLCAPAVDAQEAPIVDTDTPAVNVAGSPVLPGSAATEVWVTTQDILALRRGPGRRFPLLASVPFAITLPAYGRSSDTRWLQVEYDGQRGWLAARYLVWSGDVINLRVDGVDPAPYIRRAAALAVTSRETRAYVESVDPSNFRLMIPIGTEVELTGRLGGDTGSYLNDFFTLQVRYNGQLYWVGSHDLRIEDGDYRRLLNLAYLYRYGRLILNLEGDVALTIGSFRPISSIWSRLDQGLSIACDPIPPQVQRTITQADVTRDLTFLPAVAALDSAIAGVNSAITAFSDACANPDFVLTRATIDAQLAVLGDANRNLLLAASLLDPLRVRNPLLRGQSQ